MKWTTADEFNRKFKPGEDVMNYCDTNNVRLPELKQKRANGFLKGFFRRVAVVALVLLRALPTPGICVWGSCTGP